MDIETILRIIPTLNSRDRARIRERLDVSNSLGLTKAARSDAVEETTSDDIWILDAIVKYMQDMGLDLSGADQMRGGAHYSKFKAKVPAIVAFVKPVGNKTQQRAAVKIGVELLVQELMKIGLAVTSRSLMNHAHRIPSMINRAFPGYVQAGLLSMIVRGDKSVRKKRGDRSVPRPGRKAKAS